MIDAAEAIKTLEKLKENLSEEYPCSDNNNLSDEDINAFNISIETLKELEMENARLRRLVFDRCPMHINTPYSTDDLNCMYVDGKCEGYQRNKYDDEPPDFCKVCIINQYYEE
ncbi:MAG: hypothetical protein AB9883_07595 [Acidaminococcaceae bacterium]